MLAYIAKVLSQPISHETVFRILQYHIKLVCFQQELLCLIVTKLLSIIIIEKVEIKRQIAKLQKEINNRIACLLKCDKYTLLKS